MLSYLAAERCFDMSAIDGRVRKEGKRRSSIYVRQDVATVDYITYQFHRDHYLTRLCVTYAVQRGPRISLLLKGHKVKSRLLAILPPTLRPVYPLLTGATS